MRRRYALQCLIACIMVSLLNPSPIMTLANSGVESHQSSKLTIWSDYTEESPFSINGNLDFGVVAAANGWDGNGSYSTPYVINNLNITSTSDSTILASISNTDVYFRFEQCLLVGGSIAIELTNVTNGFVYNNTIRGCSLQGSVVSASHNIRFENNSIKDIDETGLGLYLLSVNESLVRKNIIEGNYERGILMDYSRNCSIEYNDISGHGIYGIKLRDSENNTIHENTIHHNDDSGIVMGNANHCNITNNLIYNNSKYGIDIQSSSWTLIQKNLVYNQGYSGIKLIGLFSMICNNTFYHNLDWGIQVFGSNTTSTFNNFIYNGDDGNNGATNEYGDNTYDRNFWADWNFPDSNHDLIVDNPRLIDTSEDIYDQHPVAIPYIETRMHILIAQRILAPARFPEEIYTSCTVNWTPAMDTYRHTFQYSLHFLDENDTWIEVASSLSVTQYIWNLETMPDRTNTTLRVTAFCEGGFNISGYSDPHMVLEHTIRNLRILNPYAGAEYSSGVDVQWVDSGCTINHNLGYSVYFSSDGGSTWQILAENQESNSYFWDVEEIPDGNNYLVKVIAECSEGISVEAISNGTFTISKEVTSDGNGSWIFGIAVSAGATVILAVIVLWFIKTRRMSK